MTKRFFIFAFLILVAYAFYSYTANPLLLAVTLFMVLMVIVSFLAMLIGSLRLRVEGTISTPVIKRLEPFTLRLSVMNRGWIYLPAIRLSLGYPKTNGMILSVPTDEDDRIDYDALADRLFPELREDGQLSHIRKAIFNFWTQGGSALNDADQDRQSVSQAFYRPSAQYPVYHKWLLFPRPRRIDEQKLRFFSLAPKQEIRQDFTFMANHKGTIPFGVDHLVLKDWFGFFFITRRFKVAKILVTDVAEGEEGKAAFPINVRPSEQIWEHVVQPDLTDPKQVLMAPNSVRVSPEIDTLANIREFRPGDRMKSIHWKNSARTGDWMIREFEDPRQGGLLFVPQPLWPEAGALVDGWKEVYSDQIAEVTAALLSDLAKTEGPLTLIVGQREVPASGEGEVPHVLYQELALWQPEQTGHTHAMLISEATRRQSFRGIIVVTASLTPTLEAELHRQQKSGAQIILALLHAPEAGRQALDEQTKLLRLAKVHVMYFPCPALNSSRPVQAPTNERKEVVE